ncbi:MAG: DNA alkylation repair protein [Anaerolineales bacterium]|jgi:3-methyladenine DNA glycosylase AlkD
MPAINPTALNDELESIFSLSIRRGEYIRAVQDLLSFYADRTKRSTAISAAQETSHMMHVPAPVMRTICTRIGQRGRRPDDDWLAAAEELWQSGIYEMRIVGICMLREVSLDQILERASNWAAECDDERVLQSLASEGMQSCLKSEHTRVLEAAQEWIARDPTRAFGLIVLGQLIEAGSVHDLPAIFKMLTGLASSVRGTEQDALRSLLMAIAESSPAELTAFLLEEIGCADSRSLRFFRSLIAEIPEPYQSQVRGAF